MAPTTDPRPAPAPPDVIAFDVLETLYPLAQLEPLLVAAGGDASTLGLWMARLHSDGFALTAAGDYHPFHEVAKASLQAVLPKAKAGARDKVLAGLADLGPHPDAEAAMGQAALDARVIVLTNASTDSTRKLLARTQLDTFVERIVSAEDVKAWKPDHHPYAYAAAMVDVDPPSLGLVSAHPWDVHGAHQAGLVTGWCNRDGSAFPALYGAADATGATLLDVVEGLFALKGDGTGG